MSGTGGSGEAVHGELTAQRAALLEEFRQGKRTALARAISIVEDGRSSFQRLLHELHPRIGRAHRIGITGPPGAGKSTLTALLIERFRARDETVGVIAVDPTSPYTGGALLGDRIRMSDVAQDGGVFIRSMATRGSLGGLATTTKEVADVFDAFGFDRILVETVGVGQSELDIARAADTTLVVLVPESGDSIQTMKAGLMEAADLFVVNKADRPGAARLVKEVELMLHLRAGQALRRVPGHHGVDFSTARKRVEPIVDRRSPIADASRGDPASRNAADDEASAGSGSGARHGAGPEARESASAANDGDRPSAIGDPGERSEPAEPWSIPVLQTSAHEEEGVDGLLAALEAHRAWLEVSGELESRRRRRAVERVRAVVDQMLKRAVWVDGEGETMLEARADALAEGTASPYEVAARIVRRITG